MASSPWSSPPGLSPAPAPPEPVAAFDLRPLSLGEILDRIFAIYRSHFLLFSGIATVPAMLQLALSGGLLILQHFLRARLTATALNGISTLLGVGVSLLVLLMFAVSHAATALALGEVYLGRVATVGESLRFGLRHWGRYMAIGLWQWWAAGWPAILVLVPAYILIFRGIATGAQWMTIFGGFLILIGFFGGGIAAILLFLRNALAVPASVIEGLKVRSAMRRSKQLASGTWGRIFVVLVISLGLYLVALTLEVPLGILTYRAVMKHEEAIWAQALNLFIRFISTSLTTPITLLGFALIYFDQRVRREAFDLELMLGETMPGQTPVETLTEAATPEQATPADETAGTPDHAAGV